MANPEHIALLHAGKIEWNTWRSSKPQLAPDLSNVWLNGSNLDDFDLSYVNLQQSRLHDVTARRVNFTGADLTGACFDRADLTCAVLRRTLVRALLSADYPWYPSFVETIFRYAELNAVTFHYAICKGADFTRASLFDVVFDHADLTAVTFVEAEFAHVLFSSVDLRNASGLETVAHEGPSSFTLETLRLSDGNVPSVFLQRSGATPFAQALMHLHRPDLTQDVVQGILYALDKFRHPDAAPVRSVFVSYSRIDATFVDALELCLLAAGIHTWRDVHDLVAGPLAPQLERAIQFHEAVVLVLSEASVGSDWVEWEAAQARTKEHRENCFTLCPISLDEAWKSSKWSPELRLQIKKYAILDFSGWKDEATFERAVQKLIAGLHTFYARTPNAG